ncbi:hypothetical protein [Scytonema sp. PRP1]|uniref:hypothetical protein n=1 Tax=Scytonema sp. PRP1 TaxID=3120513 RepID=UPI002FCFE9DF
MSDDQGLFQLTVDDLYCKAKNDLESFLKNPNDDVLLNVLFSFNHLRDWIYPKGHEAYKNKIENQRTKEEKIHAQLHEDEDYKIVRELCNRIKHVNKKDSASETEVKHGLFAGIARAGDKLDNRNYLVDGQDLRSILERVFDLYKGYFGNE